jgi:hypothetical protein
MDAEGAPSLALSPFLVAEAVRQLERFAGHNVRVPESDVVHAMRAARLLDVRVPGLACNTPVGGWDWMRLVPVVAVVTCHKCLSHGEWGSVSARACGSQLMLRLGLGR